MRKLFTHLFVIVGLAMVPALSPAQITVDINSGNPNFPFPQFLDYSTDRKTLASENPVGVPHAEMEQRARDAYQIMMNLAVYSGDVLNGIKYVHFQSTPDCTEGDGYAMLSAAFMADKTTFDGLWLWIHDNRMNDVTSYSQCPTVLNPTYKYGKLPGWTGTGADAAADGDFDIALALLVAWYQWGDNMGINDACGNPISYKTAATDFINALVEKAEGDVTGDSQYTSGDIGFDGYPKGGNTWQELTGWATGQNPGPQFTGPTSQHIDYYAPAYYHCFANWLQSQGQPAGNVTQFQRAEASSDWLMGQMYSENLIPVAGWVGLSGTTATFTNYNEGEDFRAGWRTVLNYVWNGNPTTTWDPVNHVVASGGNTFEHDIGVSMASFLKKPQVGGEPCLTFGSSPVTYQGVPTIVQQYSPAGAQLGSFTLDWLQGTGSPSAVAAQDFELMADMFRQCVIEWDGTTGYLNSTPVYFHGWFRLLGMLVLSGNLQSPCNMTPAANVKIYNSVDKTYGFENDIVTYTFSLRNYGSVTATGVTVTDNLPSQVEFVSASNGGTLSGNTVTWNLSNLPGLQNQDYAATKDTITLKVRIKPGATGRFCNVASVSIGNGNGWTSNEYPNNITAVMERNCVDIIPPALSLSITPSKTKVNPLDTLSYSISYKNNKAPYLNGGRTGVTIAFANGGISTSASQLGIKIRLYHGAEEAYINYKNYRINYFLNEATLPTYVLSNTIYEGGSSSGVTVSQQTLVPGSDAYGKWNQRLTIQFADQLCTTAPQLYEYYGETNRIHQGGTAPLRAVWDVHNAAYSSFDWADDWSANAAWQAADGDGYFPVTNDWSDPNNLNIPIDRLHPDACETSSITVDRVLVEEWDGYTWRRILGNGPVSGREMYNVVITDTLPAGVTFGGFLGTSGTVSGNVITWTIDTLLIGQSGTLRYWVKVKDASAFGGCPINYQYLYNDAYITATNESTIGDTAITELTCDTIIIPPAKTSMTKTADKSTYGAQDPITYTITYVNTHGAIATPDLNASTDWTLQSGPSMMTFGSGSLTTIANQSTVITYNYSHGTNGTITGTINATASATVGVAFRHKGGAMANGEYITFNQNPGAGTITIGFYNGTALVNSYTKALTGSPFNFKIVLHSDTADLYLNNFTGSPLISQTGMTVQAGYAGIINGDPTGANSWGTHTITAFSTHLDSGFDVQMTDPFPSSLTFTSATGGGTVSGGVISWPVIPGPVLAGDTITESWTGTVQNCPDTSITNTAYMKMYGISPNPGAQSTASCFNINPVELIDFKGKQQNFVVQLTWATVTENNNSYFSVQRSTDGKVFESIGTVPGHGTTRTTIDYAFTDSLPITGLNYYRLIQYDYDGRVNKSYIIAVNFEENFTLRVSPNPFSGHTLFTFYGPDAQISLQIFSVSGQAIDELTVKQGTEIVLGDQWSSGVYILKALGEKETRVVKLVKE